MKALSCAVYLCQKLGGVQALTTMQTLLPLFLKGRPKGHNNLKTDLMNEMGMRVVVKEGEKTLRLTKQQVLIKTLSTRALNGDMKAAGAVIERSRRLARAGRPHFD